MKKNVIIKFKDRDMGINDCVVGMVKIYDTSTAYNVIGNRDLDVKSLTSIRESMEEAGLISTIIVVEDSEGKFAVIDGQHRFQNAVDNGYTITATIVEPKVNKHDAIVWMNTTQFNWKPIAYLNAGIEYHRNPDYVFLSEMMEDTGISIITLYQMFAYDISDPVNKKLFESGQWKATTKELGHETIRYAEELKPYFSFAMKSDFLRGFVRCVNRKGYSQEIMLKRARKHPQHIIGGLKNPSSYVAMLNKLYNYRALESEQEYLG